MLIMAMILLDTQTAVLLCILLMHKLLRLDLMHHERP